MIRRRRRAREIPFSFDSFLDIVANVVGVIIRLILVVWIGARSYSSIQHLIKPAAIKPPVETARQIPADPLQEELARHQKELADAQRRLLDQLRQVQQVQHDEAQIRRALASLDARRQKLVQDQTSLGQEAAQHRHAAQAAVLTSTEIQLRSRKLAEEIQALEQLPSPQKTPTSVRNHRPG